MWSITSVGDFTSVRYAVGCRNSGLMNTSRMSVLTSYLLFFQASAMRVTYASGGSGMTNSRISFAARYGATDGWAMILSSTPLVSHCLVSPRKVTFPLKARAGSKIPVFTVSATRLFGIFWLCALARAIW